MINAHIAISGPDVDTRSKIITLLTQEKNILQQKFKVIDASDTLKEFLEQQSGEFNPNEQAMRVGLVINNYQTTVSENLSSNTIYDTSIVDALALMLRCLDNGTLPSSIHDLYLNTILTRISMLTAVFVHKNSDEYYKKALQIIGGIRGCSIIQLSQDIHLDNIYQNIIKIIDQEHKKNIEIYQAYSSNWVAQYGQDYFSRRSNAD